MDPLPEHGLLLRWIEIVPPFRVFPSKAPNVDMQSRAMSASGRVFHPTLNAFELLIQKMLLSCGSGRQNGNWQRTSLVRNRSSARDS